jgi:Skp family chaperone for outer membrane proteins
VKSTAIVLTGVVSLGLIVYAAAQLRAQTQQQYNGAQYNNSQYNAGQVQQATATAPMAPRTKIAVVNLQSVIKQYQKWRDFENGYKSLYDQYNTAFEKKKAQGLELKTQAEKADPSQRDDLEQRFKAIEREMQDMGEQAKKQLSRMRDEQAVQIYSEVETAVQAYARANDIEMVMHYNDAIVPADMHNPINIQRKLQTGACMPMYVAPGMDITNTIAQMLNQKLGMAPGAAPR